MAAYITAEECLGAIKETTLISLFYDVATKGDALPATLAAIAADDSKWHFVEEAEAASADLDNYLRGRYVVPVETLTDDLVAAVKTITIYKGYVRRNVVTEMQRNQYKDVISMLKDVARGVIVLSIPAVSASASRGRISMTSETRQLTREKLTGL